MKTKISFWLWMGFSTGLFAGCQSPTAPEKFVDTCADVPAACGAVYSADGKYMAYVSPTITGGADQVYRVAVKTSNARPELVSISADGQPANGSCHSVSFLGDD